MMIIPISAMIPAIIVEILELDEFEVSWDEGISVGPDDGISVGLEDEISVGLDEGILVGLDEGILVKVDFKYSLF